MAHPTVLTGMTWDHPRGFESVVACNDLIEAEFGATVEWSARSLLQFGDQHVREFAEGRDLMVIDHPHVPDAVVDGAVIAMDDLVDQDSLVRLARESAGPSHESYRFRGKIWALAIDAATQVSVYRPDLVDGVPPFWDDILADAASGRVLWPYKPVDAFSTFATLSAQMGSAIGERAPMIDEETTGRVMEFMLRFSALVPRFCATSNPFEISERLVSSDDFDYAAPLYGYTNYSRDGFRGRVLAYDDVPSFDGRATGSQLGGAGIAVSAHSKNPELAAKIAVYLSSAEAQRGPYTERHGQPGNLRAWLSPRMNDITHGFFRNTLRSIEGAWVRPRLVGWPDFQFGMSQVIHEALVRGDYLASDWTTMERHRDELMERAGE
ncbi:MAG: extracellular solute-binding protein [Pontimonas sp.]